MGTVLQLIKDMGTGKLVAIGGGIFALIIMVMVLTFKISPANSVILYSNLDINDSNKIITLLESRNITYELRANGTEILVPEDKVLKTRMSLAQEGLPSKGSLVGYEIFDQSEALGTSSFVQNVNLLRALEGEIGRTIKSFTNIDNARVHLVMPKRELFSRDKQVPTASVIIKMKGSSSLTKEQVNAISHLVATAVPGLDVSKITIVDTSGKSLKLGAKNENDPGYIASTNEEHRIAFENRLKSTVEELLEQSVGPGHVKAQVSAELNFDRIVTNEEIYDPSGQVVRSVQETGDKESSTDKESQNNVSVANNLPGAGAGDQGNNSSSSSERTDTITNYEISKTIKNHISETGTVKRLSIAVLVDGTYKVDAKAGTVTYTPRSSQELAQLEALVKTAVGFDAARKDKIEIVNMQFNTDLDSLKEESIMVWVKSELPGLAKTLVVGVIVILALLLVVRPIAIRAFEVTKADLESAESAELTDNILATSAEISSDNLQESMIDIAKIEARFKTNSSSKAINDVVAKYPQETLNTLRKWMNKE